MSAAFVIEIDGDAAGLALAERTGFRFYASARSYWELEGQWFPNLGQAERAAAAVRRRREGAASRARPPAERRDDLLALDSDAARSGAALPDGAWGLVLERYLRREEREQIAA
jgi:hypothetical protein